jgi:hypothetical protein
MSRAEAMLRPIVRGGVQLKAARSNPTVRSGPLDARLL